MLSPQLDPDQNTIQSWSRPESLCTCESATEDDVLFDYLVRKYTTSQINAKLKTARRNSTFSSRSGSSSRSASSSIFSSLTSGSRRRFSRCSMHSASNLKRSQHDAELSSCIEEPHPGTKVNIIEADRTGTPTSQPANAGQPQGKQNNPSKQYLCPFCGELDIENGISRESDLVKHFRTYHNTNYIWICRKGGCGKSFDFHSAYKQHLNDKSHPTGPVLPGNVRVLLQPQVVFACGFDGCKQVYEVDPMDLDAMQTSKDYFSHVINHMKRFINRKAPCPWEEAPVWSYSTRMRNLLRQSQVRNAWKDVSKDDRRKLTWRVEDSTTLRKMLECRDVKDARAVVLAAQELGVTASPSSPGRSSLIGRKASTGAGQSPRWSLSLTLPILDDGAPDEAFRGETAVLDENQVPMHQDMDSLSTVFSHPNHSGSNLTYTSLESGNPVMHHPTFSPLSHPHPIPYALPHHHHQNWSDPNLSPTYFQPPQHQHHHQQQQQQDMQVDPLWLMPPPSQYTDSRPTSFDLNPVPYTEPMQQAQPQPLGHIQPQGQWYADQVDVRMGSPPR